MKYCISIKVLTLYSLPGYLNLPIKNRADDERKVQGNSQFIYGVPVVLQEGPCQGAPHLIASHRPEHPEGVLLPNAARVIESHLQVPAEACVVHTRLL